MLTIGLIGCGRIGRVHADLIANNARATLARVYDPVVQAAPSPGYADGRAALVLAAAVESLRIGATVRVHT